MPPGRALIGFCMTSAMEEEGEGPRLLPPHGHSRPLALPLAVASPCRDISSSFCSVNSTQTTVSLGSP